MALTPEEVVEKTFQPTKFREGYDQQEVDLFLDDVVAELKRLNEENRTLRQALSEHGIPDPTAEGAAQTGTAGQASDAAEESGAGEGASSVAALSQPADEQTVSAPAEQDLTPAGDAPAEDAAAELPADADVVEEAETVEAPAQAESAADSAPATPQSAAPAGSTESAESAAAVIAMAQRLHDEYVSEGRSERARLISEGQLQAETLVAEAEAQRKEVMENLETNKAALESDVEALRAFEASYRARLREHLESRLTELENTAGLEPVAA
ncbi:DivIVA domain-containing protein [Rothia kristinae]|uniref:DivIVA domain-containing protein n=1 Tax=Rothia kristinae TaxID=37923 RepID=UPI003439B1AC